MIFLAGVERFKSQAYTINKYIIGRDLMEMKLEVVPIGVADIDRAKTFYGEKH